VVRALIGAWAEPLIGAGLDLIGRAGWGRLGAGVGRGAMLLGGGPGAEGIVAAGGGADLAGAGWMAGGAVVDRDDVEGEVDGAHVVPVVAGVAGIAGVGVDVADLAGEVAGGAEGGEEGMEAELGGGPGGGGVALFAAEAELAGVEGGLRVAGGAAGSGADVDVVGVTILAGDVRVGAGERVELVVVKGAHSIAAVVAVEAAIAVLSAMIGDEGGLVIGVAGDAVDAGGGKLVADVTVVAAEGLAGKVRGVQEEAKAGEQVVVDVGEGDVADDGVAAAVLDVAGLAAGGAGEDAVEADGAGALLGDLEVALLAAIGGDAVDGGVAVAAFLFELGVGRIAAEGGGPAGGAVRDGAGPVDGFEAIGADGDGERQERHDEEEAAEGVADELEEEGLEHWSS
jgi:hypothetical protein